MKVGPVRGTCTIVELTEEEKSTTSAVVQAMRAAGGSPIDAELFPLFPWFAVYVNKFEAWAPVGMHRCLNCTWKQTAQFLNIL